MATVVARGIFFSLVVSEERIETEVYHCGGIIMILLSHYFTCWSGEWKGWEILFLFKSFSQISRSINQLCYLSISHQLFYLPTFISVLAVLGHSPVTTFLLFVVCLSFCIIKAISLHRGGSSVAKKKKKGKIKKKLPLAAPIK